MNSLLSFPVKIPFVSKLVNPSPPESPPLIANDNGNGNILSRKSDNEKQWDTECEYITRLLQYPSIPESPLSTSTDEITEEVIVANTPPKKPPPPSAKAPIPPKFVTEEPETCACHTPSPASPVPDDLETCIYEIILGIDYASPLLEKKSVTVLIRGIVSAMRQHVDDTSQTSQKTHNLVIFLCRTMHFGLNSPSSNSLQRVLEKTHRGVLPLFFHHLASPVVYNFLDYLIHLPRKPLELQVIVGKVMCEQLKIALENMTQPDQLEAVEKYCQLFTTFADTMNDLNIFDLTEVVTQIDALAHEVVRCALKFYSRTEFACFNTLNFVLRKFSRFEFGKNPVPQFVQEVTLNLPAVVILLKAEIPPLLVVHIVEMFFALLSVPAPDPAFLRGIEEHKCVDALYLALFEQTRYHFFYVQGIKLFEVLCKDQISNVIPDSVLEQLATSSLPSADAISKPSVTYTRAIYEKLSQNPRVKAINQRPRPPV